MKSKKSIGAYEVRQWCFCPRQWYLFRTMGRIKRASNSRKGMEFHRSASRPIKAIQKTQSMIVTAIVMGGIVCLIWFFSLSH